MEIFRIKGGSVIQGEITPSGNKNEALPVLAASLLSNEPVILNNVPDILDVRVMVEIMQDLGVVVERLNKNKLKIDASSLQDKPLNRKLCEKIRTSILFAGPLLAKFGNVLLPPPGGDVIGRRRIDSHFIGFEQLGAIYTVSEKGYTVITKSLQGADIFLDEASVTGTENVIMAAVLAKGTTFINNAATEPHVQGLCNFLNLMGAKISGIGTNILKIEGVEFLKGAEYTISPDYIEAGSYIVLAAITGGELLIKNTAPKQMRKIFHSFSKIGINVEVKGEDVFVPHHSQLVVKKDFNNAVPRIDDGIWPAFPSDLMSLAIVGATQAKGMLIFFEKMFESRLFFVDRLIGMGAQIILCDPHRVVVSGSAKLYGTKLESPDIRAGMAMLIAAVAAQGESTIYNIRQIDRGYESVEKKLQQIGVNIIREDV